MPENFEIIRLEAVGAFTAAEVRWPDAKNFEGRKILLYKATPREVASATRLDPHFCETAGKLVPVARFEPTPRGWQWALTMAREVKP